jgi:hypothetical protein
MSLTPQTRADEAVKAAHDEGVLNFFIALVPSMGSVALAMRYSPYFVKRTNWQIRTALILSPPSFAYMLTGEQKLSHKMREIASETQHSEETVKWAEQQWQEELKRRQQVEQQQNTLTESEHIAALYKQSLAGTGVRIVPELQWYHNTSNYISENPVKVLAVLAVPAVAGIFHGRNEQQHLQIASKLMHTRVIGQFVTVMGLLSIMGFKDYMDRNGLFISQQQADERIAEMHAIRTMMKERLEIDRLRAEEMQQKIALAHERDESAKQAKQHAKSLKKTKKDDRVLNNEDNLNVASNNETQEEASNPATQPIVLGLSNDHSNA